MSYKNKKSKIISKHFDLINFSSLNFRHLIFDKTYNILNKNIVHSDLVIHSGIVSGLVNGVFTSLTWSASFPSSISDSNSDCVFAR